LIVPPKPARAGSWTGSTPAGNSELAWPARAALEFCLRAISLFSVFGFERFKKKLLGEPFRF